MDWAEELKMSLRKTTARKGRRAKSRDLLKSDENGSSTSVSSPNVGLNKELSIDITLDIQQNSNMASKSTNDSNRPPVRSISGGWADSGPSVLKSSKSKRGSFEDDRFQRSIVKSATSSPPDEDIPILPDLEEVKDEPHLNEIIEPLSVVVNRVDTLKELNSDLLSQNAFSGIEDVDLSILTRCLLDQETLDEADEFWEWDKVFTDVVAEINAEKSRSAAVQKIEIRPDEVPPTIHT